MDKFKQDIFYQETGKSFPHLDVLDIGAREKVIKDLYNFLGIDKVKKGLFQDVSSILLIKDFESEKLDSAAIFDEFDFDSTNSSLIIWDENEIDRMKTSSILEYWEFIWYGISDDAIMLYQEENQKILILTHFGRVYYN